MSRGYEQMPTQNDSQGEVRDEPEAAAPSATSATASDAAPVGAGPAAVPPPADDSRPQVERDAEKTQEFEDAIPAPNLGQSGGQQEQLGEHPTEQLPAVAVIANAPDTSPPGDGPLDDGLAGVGLAGDERLDASMSDDSSTTRILPRVDIPPMPLLPPAQEPTPQSASAPPSVPVPSHAPDSLPASPVTPSPEAETSAGGSKLPEPDALAVELTGVEAERSGLKTSDGQSSNSTPTPLGAPLGSAEQTTGEHAAAEEHFAAEQRLNERELSRGTSTAKAAFSQPPASQPPASTRAEAPDGAGSYGTTPGGGPGSVGPGSVDPGPGGRRADEPGAEDQELGEVTSGPEGLGVAQVTPVGGPGSPFSPPDSPPGPGNTSTTGADGRMGAPAYVDTRTPDGGQPTDAIRPSASTRSDEPHAAPMSVPPPPLEYLREQAPPSPPQPQPPTPSQPLPAPSSRAQQPLDPAVQPPPSAASPPLPQFQSHAEPRPHSQPQEARPQAQAYRQPPAVPVSVPVTGPEVAGAKRRPRHGDSIPRRTVQALQRLVSATARETTVATETARAIQQPIPNGRQLAVTSIRGGAGKSTVAALLALTYAHYRGDPALAIEADPALGTLPGRLGASEVRWTCGDLARIIDPSMRLTDITGYLVRLSGGGWLLPASQGSVGTQLDIETYRVVMTSLRRYFGTTVVDCETLPAEVARTALTTTQARVLVTPATVEGVAATRSVLDWMSGLHPNMLRTTVVVLAHSVPDSALDEAKAARHLGMGGVTVVSVPYDRHLAAGGAIRTELLGHHTREAAARLAAECMNRAVAFDRPVGGTR